MLASFQACEQESVLRTFKIVYIVLNIIRVVVPVIIVALGTKDMANVVIAGQEDEMKQATKQLIRRVIAGLIVFLLPNAINVIFKIADSYEERPTEFNSCSICLTNGKECDTLMAMARERKELEYEREKAKYANRYALSQEDIDNYNRAIHEMLTQERKTVQESNPTSRTTVDPNNATTKYFNSNNVTQISGLTEQELIAILQKTSAYHGKASMYIPYAKDLIAAEKNHGVNAFYLIGVYSLESGWLKSALANECDNIGGVRFYNQSYGNGKKVRNCRNGWAGFDSKSEFIDFHASLLERAYLTPGASHFYGYSVADVATDYGHSNGVNDIIQIAAKVSSQ